MTLRHEIMFSVPLVCVSGEAQGIQASDEVEAKKDSLLREHLDLFSNWRDDTPD